MVTNKRKPLTVYKASAGSGKTFTLATEYIRLLIENPQSYRTILAVTFTNKATEEMKTRILSQLYGIWKQLPDSAKYMDAVQKSTILKGHPFHGHGPDTPPGGTDTRASTEGIPPRGICQDMGIAGTSPGR